MGRTRRRKQLIASNLSLSSEQWISIVHKIIAPLTLLWPSPRPSPLRILETTPSKIPNPQPCRLGILETSRPRKLKLSTSPHSLRHISRGLRMARPPTKRLGRRRSDNVAWNTSGLETTLVPSQPPRPTPPMLLARPGKDLSHVTCFNYDKKSH